MWMSIGYVHEELKLSYETWKTMIIVTQGSQIENSPVPLLTVHKP